MASRVWKAILTVLLVTSATVISAETYKEIYASGAWVLYEVEGMEVQAPDGRYERIDELCVASFNASSASLKFAMAPSSAVRSRPDLRDYIWVQVSAESWNFRNRTGPAGLSVEISSYTEKRARYDGMSINFGVPNFKRQFGVFLMFAGARQSIDVLGRHGETIARFPANGFSAVRDRLLACAGA